MANLENTRRLRDAMQRALDAGFGLQFRMGSWFWAGGLTFHSVERLARKVGLGPEVARDPTRWPCGTTCCMAGFAQAVGAETDEERAMSAEAFAQMWLDLGDDEVSDLFYGYFPKPSGLEEPSMADAIAELDRMVREMEQEDAVCSA